MKIIELKYMGRKIKCKEFTVNGKTDNYGKQLTRVFAPTSEATKETNEDTGIMRYSAGPFFDMFIERYIDDEKFDMLDDDTFDEIIGKIK